MAHNITVINGVNICTKCGVQSSWEVKPCRDIDPHSIVPGAVGPICSRCGVQSSWEVKPCRG